jgi:bile acid:Na+ symporter, BASS family
MDYAAIISKLMLPLGLAFIMFAMGLTLKFCNFKRVLKYPLAIFIGLFVQILVLPLAAFLLLQSWPIAPVLAVGIMILAASPGGITSNLLTHLARGDTALSVTMTAISSLAGLITVPLIVGFSVAYFLPSDLVGELSVANMMISVFMVSTLPVLIGVAINQLWPVVAEHIERIAAPLSVGVFVFIVFGAFASSWQVMMENIMVIGPHMLVLNILIMLVGWSLARVVGLERTQAVAICMEGGLQNGALGIFVSLTLLQSTTLMIPSITYALIMNLTAAVLVFWRLQKTMLATGSPR